MTGLAQPPTITSSWTYPPASPGLWFNTTDASQDGAALVSFGTGEPNKDKTLTPGHYYVLGAKNGGGRASSTRRP